MKIHGGCKCHENTIFLVLKYISVNDRSLLIFLVEKCTKTTKTLPKFPLICLLYLTEKSKIWYTFQPELLTVDGVIASMCLSILILPTSLLSRSLINSGSLPPDFELETGKMILEKGLYLTEKKTTKLSFNKLICWRETKCNFQQNTSLSLSVHQGEEKQLFFTPLPNQKLQSIPRLYCPTLCYPILIVPDGTALWRTIDFFFFFFLLAKRF